jgi:hypothetical protein
LEASGRGEAEPSLPQPFLDFAKATIIYLQDTKPAVDQGTRISALRCLEAALRECRKDSRPTAVDETILDTAVELAMKRGAQVRACGIAAQLELIAEMMRSKRFISLRQRWKHGIKNPRRLGSRISKEALAARQKKLPSAAALRALGAIFYEAVESSDVLVASYTALMLCAPERINEVLRLNRRCLVKGDAEYCDRWGLRWPGSKRFDNTIKWLPTEMTPIARKAVDNIIRVTAPAQKLAAWYATNPNTLYLHEGAAHLRNKKILSLAEIALILWNDESATNNAGNWARETNKLPKQHLDGRRFGYFFVDVERAVLAMLPETFPYMPGAPELLCHKSMAIMRRCEMNMQKMTFVCMFSCVDYGVLAKRLAGEECYSIFERFNFKEDDGEPIRVKSHSLRHYLNMLAQTGGLSSAEIAIFSGRKDVQQNRVYDHMSSDEVQAPIKLALQSGFTAELESVFDGERKLVMRSEFESIGLTSGHTTEYGWCVHDFASEPCQMYRDCINCEEQECVKGDAQKEANLRMLKSEGEYLLKKAREALSEEEFGADTWVKHQQVTLERVEALLSILEDPAIPVGARVRLDVNNAPLITKDDVHPVKFSPAVRRKAVS